VGANPHAEITGLDRQPAQNNYFTGITTASDIGTFTPASTRFSTAATASSNSIWCFSLEPIL
jgi:hypothetical protein